MLAKKFEILSLKCKLNVALCVASSLDFVVEENIATVRIHVTVVRTPPKVAAEGKLPPLKSRKAKKVESHRLPCRIASTRPESHLPHL